MTGDLAVWLRAQLDADEQTARAARDAVDRDWEFRPVGRYNDEWALHDDSGGLIFIADRCPPVVGVHIARHDPAFTLADITAKRATIDEYQRVCALPIEEGYDAGYECGLERAVRLLAQPYAGRLGWRDEWTTT